MSYKIGEEVIVDKNLTSHEYELGTRVKITSNHNNHYGVKEIGDYLEWFLVKQELRKPKKRKKG